jgi:hypothetical protein
LVGVTTLGVDHHSGQPELKNREPAVTVMVLVDLTPDKSGPLQARHLYAMTGRTGTAHPCLIPKSRQFTPVAGVP